MKELKGPLLEEVPPRPTPLVESGEGIESGASDPERRRQHMWNPVKELKEKIQILNNVYLLR